MHIQLSANFFNFFSWRQLNNAMHNVFSAILLMVMKITIYVGWWLWKNPS